MAKTKPTITTEASTPNIVVQQITIKQTTYSTQDIDNWKAARTQFASLLNPSRVKLYDLLTDIAFDGQIESTWGKRQDAILNKKFVFSKEGKEDEEINKLLNSSSMRLFIKELHNAIAWGYTLIFINSIVYNEEEEQYNISFDLIPRKHVHPERNFECISKDQTSVTLDFLFKQPPLSQYMIWAGEATDMGLLFKAAAPVIYKRGNFGDWAQFAELFGMPFREAHYDDFDDKTRIALEQAMDSYGGNGYAILPKNADFKLHDAVKGTAGDLYKGLNDACNAEISKIILGNTLTTEQGDKGARSLGDVHKEGEESKNEADEKFIIDLLNSKFKAILKLFGFNVQGGQIGFHSEGKDWDQLTKKWTVLKDLKDTIPIEDDFFYNQFDIPKPLDYDTLKAEMDNRALNAIEKAVQDPLNPNPKKGADPSSRGGTTKQSNLIRRIQDFFV